MQKPRNPTVGEGFIEIQPVQKKTSVTKQQDKKLSHFIRADVVSRKHTYPFQFHVPENAHEGPCKWIYLMSYGGGLVGGDTVTAGVKVGDGCAVLVSTQESTKVFHCNNSGETVQNINYQIGEGSLLCILPDSTVCYKDANFNQSQVIHMKSSSNLVILDWMLSGRFALDEFWAFKRYRNCIEVNVAGELVIKDNSDLEDTPYQTVCQGMQNFHVFGTCIVIGNGLEFLSQILLETYSRKKNYNDPHDQNLIVSISETEYTVNGKSISGCYLRFLASEMKFASKVIKEITTPLMEVLGGDPFERKL
ncbi:hypothetical protein Btru_033369 [Bulinus truncatus]|nr:hypothetical protein Btru_033369 [Bulinus truncatus]